MITTVLRNGERVHGGELEWRRAVELQPFLSFGVFIYSLIEVPLQLEIWK